MQQKDTADGPATPLPPLIEAVISKPLAGEAGQVALETAKGWQGTGKGEMVR